MPNLTFLEKASQKNSKLLVSEKEPMNKSWPHTSFQIRRDFEDFETISYHNLYPSSTKGPIRNMQQQRSTCLQELTVLLRRHFPGGSLRRRVKPSCVLDWKNPIINAAGFLQIPRGHESHAFPLGLVVPH